MKSEDPKLSGTGVNDGRAHGDVVDEAVAGGLARCGGDDAVGPLAVDAEVGDVAAAVGAADEEEDDVGAVVADDGEGVGVAGCHGWGAAVAEGEGGGTVGGLHDTSCGDDGEGSVFAGVR